MPSFLQLRFHLRKLLPPLPAERLSGAAGNWSSSIRSELDMFKGIFVEAELSTQLAASLTFLTHFAAHSVCQVNADADGVYVDSFHRRSNIRAMYDTAVMVCS